MASKAADISDRGTINRTARTVSDGQDTRRHILDCAARIFREKGYAAASLRDIASAANMRTASLYHHFRSKDDIVVEVLNIAVRTVFDEVRKGLEGLEHEPPLTRIQAAIAAHLRSIFETDDYNGASIRIFAQLPPHIGEMTEILREDYIKFWRDLIEEARKNGDIGAIDPTIFRLFLFGAMNWTPQWYKEGKYDLNDIAWMMTRIYFLGAKAL